MAREAAWRVLDQRPFDVQVMGGAALHFGNVAEMKTGEGKTLTSRVARLPQRARRQGRARRHRQRLPGQTRQRVDGPGAPLPRPGRRRDPGADDARRAPRRLRRRHHLRHQQRVRLRLPARQHGALARRPGAARPQLRHRRRGRLDPDRRGPHPADHLRPGRRRVELVHRVRPAGAADGEGRPLRGRPAQAHRRRARAGRRVRRGPARHRQPLRGRQLAAGQLPQQRAEGQGAVQPRQGLHRPRRRGADRRRVHRPRAGSAAATTRACTRPSRPRSTSRSRPRTRRWPPSRCRTTSGSTTSSPA